MRRKAALPRPKESPQQQHKRFVETAKKLGASETPEDFDRAFKKVTAHPPKRETK